MYGIIPTNIRRSPSLSDKAKLIYCEITASLNEEMECTLTNQDFADMFGVSPTTARRYIYELKEIGLITASSDDNQRVIKLPEGFVQINEEARKKKSPKSLEKAKEVTEKVVSLWNSKLGTGIRVVPGLIGTIASRLKGFTEEDIILAVENRISRVIESEWHNEEANIHHRNNIYLVVGDDKAMQKCLNSKTGKKFKEDNVGNRISMIKYR